MTSIKKQLEALGFKESEKHRKLRQNVNRNESNITGRGQNNRNRNSASVQLPKRSLKKLQQRREEQRKRRVADRSEKYLRDFPSLDCYQPKPIEPTVRNVKEDRCRHQKLSQSELIDKAERAIKKLRESWKISKNRYAETKVSWHDESIAEQQYAVYLGIDFGTAFTKVIVGEVTAHFAIPSPVSAGGSDYFLPSSLVIDSNGVFSLAAQPIDDEILINDIKQRLLSGDLSEKIQIYVIAFLALVIRYSRNWMLNSRKDVYKGKDIDWFLNLALATDSFHDRDSKNLYEKSALLAWAISLIPENITLDLCTRFLACYKEGSFEKLCEQYSIKDKCISKSKIAVVPEFVAQIASYISSPRREGDLHLLVDIGAGTLDVVFFNVLNDDDFKFPIFSKSVHVLGGEILREKREALNPKAWNEDVPFRLFPLPDTEQFADILMVSVPILTNHDGSFADEVRGQLRSQIDYVKNDRYPTSRNWVEGVPTFLCGGGSTVDFYHDTIIKYLNSQASRHKFRYIKIPNLKALRAPGLRPVDQHRMMVAYGLSLDPFNLGEAIEENKIEDLKAKKIKSFTERFISKDMT